MATKRPPRRRPAPRREPTDLEKTETLQAGDACEFHYPARREWIPGVVVRNGGRGFWTIRDPATDETVNGLYIENVRAPGTDPWNG